MHRFHSANVDGRRWPDRPDRDAVLDAGWSVATSRPRFLGLHADVVQPLAVVVDLFTVPEETRQRVFVPGGRRDAILTEMWPSATHWRDVLAALNAVPEGPEVKRGTMMQRAQALNLRRPFPPGRYGREMMLGLPTTLSLAFFAWLVLAAFGAHAAPPAGSDPTSPMARWYRGLTIPRTSYSCCDEADCRPAAARLVGGAWEAQTPAGDWVPVPANRILTDQNHPSGSAVLCFMAGRVMCFVPPGVGG